MRISWLAIAAAASLAFCGSAHATEYVVDGTFTDLTAVSPPPSHPADPSGLGQLGYNTNAAGWTNGHSGNNWGYNFVMTNGATGSPGVDGGLSLWTHSTNSANSWNGLTASGTGNFLALDGDYQTAKVSQTINNLTVGQTYTFSFNYAFGQQHGFNGDTVQYLDVTLGGVTTQVPNPSYTLTSHGFSGWSTFTETVTATDTSEVLSFLAHGNLPVPPFALVSDVSLTGTSAAPGPGPATGPLAVLGLLALGYARLRRARGQA
jgi:hypothetical protein